MPRKDKYHDAVRAALENDGWRITNDPLTVPTPGMEMYIDIGAERTVIGAEKAGEQIAVEVKSLLGGSYYYDFYQALGQFLIYRLAMNKRKMLMPLFLAIPNFAYEKLAKVEIFRESWQFYSVHLLVFDERNESILLWIKN